MFAHVTRSHICKMIKKRRNLHKNRVQSSKEYFTPPTWPPRRHVMNTLYVEARGKVLGCLYKNIIGVLWPNARFPIF